MPLPSREDRARKIREAQRVLLKLADAWTCPKCEAPGILSEMKVERETNAVRAEISCLACGESERK